MGQALYRKYRSKDFGDVVGQDHIVTTLANALKSGRISHAYLFTGPRGVGKTSVARILAHEVNQLDYKDESVHLDIIEIDAASNRRIDEIRELRDRVHIAPTSAKYKVYIIDEVHMLTREAFNALLKTLEEPPAHCIFILATTEAHKVPETIISRTQRFEFKPVTTEDAAKHLSQIAKKESIDIEPEALELLAEHGAGSFRDSISLLDQLSSAKRITTQSVRQTLGLPPAAAVDSLIKSITAGDSKATLNTLDDFKQQGIDSTVLSKLLGQSLRRMLIDHSEAWMLTFAKQLIEVPASANPQEVLEIYALEAASSHSSVQKPTVAAQVVTHPTSIVSSAKPSTPKSKINGFSLDQWPDVLEAVKAKAPALYTALRLAQPSLEDQTLTLAFEFPLHQKKVNLTKHKDLLSDIISENYGSNLSVDCMVDKQAKPSHTEPTATANAERTNNISNIFGATEVLES